MLSGLCPLMLQESGIVHPPLLCQDENMQGTDMFNPSGILNANMRIAQKDFILIHINISQ
jgi:hypothetical protein